MRKPTRLCAPADTNNQVPGAETHGQFLLCYQIKQKSLPKFAGMSPVFVSDQFGPETLTATKLGELCVPANERP